MVYCREDGATTELNIIESTEANATLNTYTMHLSQNLTADETYRLTIRYTVGDVRLVYGSHWTLLRNYDARQMRPGDM